MKLHSIKLGHPTVLANILVETKEVDIDSLIDSDEFMNPYHLRVGISEGKVLILFFGSEGEDKYAIQAFEFEGFKPFMGHLKIDGCCGG